MTNKLVSAVVVFAMLVSFLSLPVPRSYAQDTCGPLDVVFVIDDTGSMSGAIGNVKTGIGNLIAKIDLASNGDYQLGLVTFKDNVTVRNDLAVDNDAAVRASIDAMLATGGAGLPEASDEALNTVIHGHDEVDRTGGEQMGDFNGVFRPNATKIVVLVTDALPGGFDDAFSEGIDDVNAGNRAIEARDKAIKISAIYVSTSLETGAVAQGTSLNDVTASSIPEIMQTYATTTGGFYLNTSDGTGVSNAVGFVIDACGSGTGTTVPEPMTIILLGSGAAALGAYIRKRKKDDVALD